MEDILSQEEIDLLIHASRQDESLEVEDLQEPQHTDAYDFRKPNKFSKEHMRALQRIHEHFCRTYAGMMSAKLRTRLELGIKTIEQLTFGEFVRSLPNPSVLAIFDVQPSGNSMIIQMSPDAAFVLYDRLCGGPGRPSDRSRGLSEIELAVLRRQVMTVFSRMLADAWAEVRELEFELDHMESNPQFLQAAADRDVVVLITLSFELNDVQDMLNICIPFRTLEPLMKQLTKARLFDSLRPPEPEQVERLQQKVRSAVLPVEVELGTAQVTVQDLLDLEVGDVITLDQNRQQNLDVKIGSLTKFKATPGKLGSRLGVVITSLIEQGE